MTENVCIVSFFLSFNSFYIYSLKTKQHFAIFLCCNFFCKHCINIKQTRQPEPITVLVYVHEDNKCHGLKTSAIEPDSCDSCIVA